MPRTAATLAAAVLLACTPIVAIAAPKDPLVGIWRDGTRPYDTMTFLADHSGNDNSTNYALDWEPQGQRRYLITMERGDTFTLTIAAGGVRARASGDAFVWSKIVAPEPMPGVASIVGHWMSEGDIETFAANGTAIAPAGATGRWIRRSANTYTVRYPSIQWTETVVISPDKEAMTVTSRLGSEDAQRVP